MAYICFNCGKGSWRSVRGQHHKGVAGGQWKHKAQKSVKIFKPNLHAMRVVLEGTIKRVKLCTDCISLMRKNGQLVRNRVILKRLSDIPPVSSKPQTQAASV